MSVNETARYRTVARFEAMTAAALPEGATVQAIQDRRGRLVLQCAWPASAGTATRAAVRIVIVAETLSCYLTATHEQRLDAQARFAHSVQGHLKRPVGPAVGRGIEEWVMTPPQLFPDEG